MLVKSFFKKKDLKTYLSSFYVYWCFVRSPGARVTDSYELPCGCWELNLGPLEEQPVLLTTEPFLQPTFNLRSQESEAGGSSTPDQPMYKTRACQNHTKLCASSIKLYFHLFLSIMNMILIKYR